MAKLNFPASPSNGDTTTTNGNTYTYYADPGVWKASIFSDAPAGPAGTIAIGTVTTAPAGGSASVTNTGTTTAAVFDFTIPGGADGAAGPPGSSGPPGGAGVDGTAATISIGTVTTGPAGSSAAVTNSGTSAAAVLDFTVPTGPAGADGAAATDADTLDGVDGASYLRSDVDDEFGALLTLSNSGVDVVNFSANSSDDNRGIAFNARTALSADYNDGYLRLNNASEFSNGVFTPGVMRADGGFTGTASSANWADVAEKYEADGIYEPGTLLAIGGEKEVTLYRQGLPFAGVVSTNPGFLLNIREETKEDEWHLVALKGRIPVNINGSAKKGDYIIADDNGKGRAASINYGIDITNLVGIALEDGTDVVEVKV